MNYTRKPYRFLCALFLMTLPYTLVSEVRHYRNPETGLSSWKAEHETFSLELIQVVPDYVRAVYASRGLPAELIEQVTRYCVFGTIVRNESQAPLSWQVSDWRYVTRNGRQHKLKPKSEWVKEWHKQGVAFRWTLLPDDQTYAVGDWGQGFITLKLRPGESFDLLYSWSQHDKIQTGKIENAQCVPAQSMQR